MSHRNGFTLIELLVAIGLILVLTGLLVAGYSRFNNTQLVISSANTFKGNLRAAQTNAASGVKPAGCDTLIGYEVDFPSTTAYSIAARCLVNGTQQLVGIVTPYTLPTNVQFSVKPSTIIFYPVNQGASGAQSIVLTGVNNTVTIQVFSSGAIGTTAIQNK